MTGRRPRGAAAVVCRAGARRFLRRRLLSRPEAYLLPRLPLPPQVDGRNNQWRQVKKGMLQQGVASSRAPAHVKDVLQPLNGHQLKGTNVARRSGHQHGQGGGGDDEGRRLKADPQVKCLLHDEHHQHRAEPGGERPAHASGQDSGLAEDAKPLHDRLRRLVQARPIARRKQAGTPVRDSQGPLSSQRQRGQEHGQNQEPNPSHQSRGGGPGRHVDEGQEEDEHQDHRQHVQHPFHDNG